jgi:hypothetical protein
LVTDPDDVALFSTHLGEHLGHAKPFEPMVDVCERLGRGHIVESDDALDFLADQTELTFANNFDYCTLCFRADRDNAFGVLDSLTSIMHSHCHLADEFAETLACHRGHDVAGPTQQFKFVGLDGIGLRTDDEARTVQKVGLILAQFLEKNPFLLLRRHAIHRCEVDHDAQHQGPLDVAQELMPKTLALARPFDEAGNVSHNKFGSLIELDNAQVWFKGRERVVRNLRLGLRDHTDQG